MCPSVFDVRHASKLVMRMRPSAQLILMTGRLVVPDGAGADGTRMVGRGTGGEIVGAGIDGLGSGTDTVGIGAGVDAVGVAIAVGFGAGDAGRAGPGDTGVACSGGVTGRFGAGVSFVVAGSAATVAMLGISTGRMGLSSDALEPRIENIAIAPPTISSPKTPTAASATMRPVLLLRVACAATVGATG